VSRARWYKPVLYIVLLVTFVLYPVFTTNLYQIGALTLILVDVLLAASVWLIITTGQVTLGQTGFAAIGGFMSAAIITAYRINSWLTLPIAVITAGTVGLVLGYITLRIKGVYFIIATLALGEFIKIVFGMWEHPFGGLHGIMNIPYPDPIIIPGLLTIEFTSNRGIYYITLFSTVIGIIIMHKVYAGPIGRVFRSIRQADELAENVGINIMNYKVLAFVIACVFSGLAGVLYVYSTKCISPTSFSINQAAYYLLCVVIGGGTSVAGPILGAIFLGLFSEIVRPVIEWRPIIFGLLLILAILYFRSGLLGIIQKIWKPLSRLSTATLSDSG